MSINRSNLTQLCYFIYNIVTAPPLEYMASLHSSNQEISGRQVWTGSLSLANTLLCLTDDEKRNVFDNRRYDLFRRTL